MNKKEEIAQKICLVIKEKLITQPQLILADVCREHIYQIARGRLEDFSIEYLDDIYEKLKEIKSIKERCEEDN